MNIEIKNQMVWGTIRAMFSSSERFETDQLIRKLKILLSQASEHGCFITKTQTSDTGLQHNENEEAT